MEKHFLNLHRLISLAVFAIGISLTLSLWVWLTSAEHQQKQQILDAAAHNLTERINHEFSQQIAALKRMSDRWLQSGGTPERLWRKDAAEYLADFGNFKAVEWADPNYFIRWIEPVEGNEAAIGFNVAFNEVRKSALNQARLNGSVDSTPVIDLQQGGKGIVFYTPIGKGDNFQGFIIGVFLVKELLESLIEEVDNRDFFFRVYEEKQTIYENSAVAELAALYTEVNWTPVRLNWRLQIFPTAAWLDRYTSLLPEFVMISGALLSALLAWMVHLSASLLQQKNALTETNKVLQAEISGREEAEQKLSHVANHDALTGLPNRNFFQEYLSQAIERTKHKKTFLAVLTLDLDQFKKVNDSLGHAVGDELLKQVVARLTSSLADETSPARAGGDEFMLMMEDAASVDEVIATANRIQACFEMPFELDSRELFITCSIGIAVYPEGGDTAEALISSSDAALYKVKASGRNGYQFFTTGMHAEALRRLELDRLLRDALEEDQFSLVFQPKVDLSTLDITGAEVLLRWNHPEKGFIPPSEFIPLAEETGMIRQIGHWVLKAACMQIQKWQGTDLGKIHLAVNLSGIQMEDEHLLKKVEEILTEFRIPTSQLEFELTEEVFISNIQTNQDSLEEFRALGISLSIDDFGVGYSSLAYLKHFPVSCLKIDRSFVSQLEVDKDDQIIINAVIALAHKMQLKVVAEGVENQAQLQYLQDEGCDEAQGYYFARPLPAAEFENFVKEKGNLVT